MEFDPATCGEDAGYECGVRRFVGSAGRFEGVEELAEDAGPDGGVVGGVGHAADEAADDGLAGVGGVAAGVAGLEEDVLEQVGEALEVA